MKIRMLRTVIVDGARVRRHQDIDVTERRARDYFDRGLAIPSAGKKQAEKHENKMAPDGENKSGPLDERQSGGRSGAKAKQSSSSQADQAPKNKSSK